MKADKRFLNQPLDFWANIKLISQKGRGFECDYDPKELTAFTKDKFPVRTLSRRVDGAFPNVINPMAIWEIKEYYFTTTFGSRVADGVYESWLDGLELREIKENLGIHVEHYLIKMCIRDRGMEEWYRAAL